MGRARGEVEVRGRFREGICQIWVHFLMEDVPVPGGGSFATASERSEYRSVLERQEFVVRNGAYAKWRMTISERK